MHWHSYIPQHRFSKGGVIKLLLVIALNYGANSPVKLRISFHPSARASYQATSTISLDTERNYQQCENQKVAALTQKILAALTRSSSHHPSDHFDAAEDHLLHLSSAASLYQRVVSSFDIVVLAVPLALS